MDNYFITQHPYSINTKKNSDIIRFVNKALRFLRTGYNVAPMDTSLDMNTVEQRINYYHLLDAAIIYGVEGDVIELGCFTGQCAVLFQKTLKLRKSDKKLHVYDSFLTNFTTKGNIEEELHQNFKKAGLESPVIHRGIFLQTIPAQLPDKIAFVHIDCGYGGDKFEHKAVMQHCFRSIYDKMSKGGVCVLMDYYDPQISGKSLDINPGVKLACDDFFADKPEELVSLYGNQYHHAYFRKL